MKKQTIKKLEKILDDDLNNFENVSLSDDSKAKNAQVISKEIAIILSNDKDNFERKCKQNQIDFEVRKFKFDEEKFEHDKKIKETQLSLDREKFKYDKKIKNVQVEIDKTKLELDRKKLDIDLENMRHQNKLAESKLENDLKTSKFQIVVSVIGIVSTFLLGILSKMMYARLAHNAQIHEYNDYQIEPNSSKENRQNLLK